MRVIMALNIANRKVEEKAIRASRILGVNKTAAVEIALDYYLEHHSAKQDDNANRQEAARLLDELAELPVLDDREPDEILGYDENGLG
jgi:antitoxin VapB